jgi:hypothetical protein
MKPIFQFSVLVLTSFLLLACEPATEVKNDPTTPESGQTVPLKVSLAQGVEDLSSAVKAIHNSESFQLLAGIAPGTEGSGSPSFAPDLRRDSLVISLADVSGVYEYSWKKLRKMNNNLLRVFDRTADNEHLIVRLPAQKVKNYHRLFIYAPRDTALTNNFEAVVSEYLLSRHYLKGLEYKLTSSMKVDDKSLGSVKISRIRNKVNGFNFSSEYALGSGFVVSNTQNSGDTAVSVYAISKDGVVLFEEKMTSYRISQENKMREKVFSLTIGKVTIVRIAGTDSFANAKIYVDGVLQENAKAEIVITEETNEEKGVTYQRRDVKLTFDDGTTTTLRELKGDTIEELGLIFASVRQIGFASEIIDRIAANIFWTKK